MKQTILPRDYPDLDTSCMHIYLINATPRLLGAMSERSSREAEKALKRTWGEGDDQLHGDRLC